MRYSVTSVSSKCGPGMREVAENAKFLGNSIALLTVDFSFGGNAV